MEKFQHNSTKNMPARPKNRVTWGVNATIFPGIFMDLYTYVRCFHLNFSSAICEPFISVMSILLFSILHNRYM